MPIMKRKAQTDEQAGTVAQEDETIQEVVDQLQTDFLKANPLLVESAFLVPKRIHEKTH